MEKTQEKEEKNEYSLPVEHLVTPQAANSHLSRQHKRHILLGWVLAAVFAAIGLLPRLIRDESLPADSQAAMLKACTVVAIIGCLCIAAFLWGDRVTEEAITNFSWERNMMRSESWRTYQVSMIVAQGIVSQGIRWEVLGRLGNATWVAPEDSLGGPLSLPNWDTWHVTGDVSYISIEFRERTFRPELEQRYSPFDFLSRA